MTSWYSDLRLEPAHGVFIPDRDSSLNQTGTLVDSSGVIFTTNNESKVVLSKIDGLKFSDSGMNITKDNIILPNGDIIDKENAPSNSSLWIADPSNETSAAGRFHIQSNGTNIVVNQTDNYGVNLLTWLQNLSIGDTLTVRNKNNIADVGFYTMDSLVSSLGGLPNLYQAALIPISGPLLDTTPDVGYYIGYTKNGSVGAQGEIGPMGADGPQGVEGNVGQQGEIGPTGADGAQGPQGDIGPQGIQGDRGATGPVGAQGEIGPQGPQGNAGADGAQGPQGNIGPQGIQGDRGATGPVGAQGEIGPQGPQGNAGADGAQGPQGNIGPQGIQGDRGATGAVGPQGPQGNAGADGAQGPQGDIGPQGPQGDRGPQGNAGADGAQGPQGDAGPQGPQGDAGPQGPQGNAGADGADGAQGPQGDRGPQGNAGADGAQGPQGDIGPQGPQGDIGPQGPQGDPATDASTLQGFTPEQLVDGRSGVGTASDLAEGWYTIAVVPAPQLLNNQCRAVARFGVRDIHSGHHQSLVFYACHMYGRESSITILNSCKYSQIAVDGIRIMENETYDGALLQVRVSGTGDNSLRVFLLGDNFQIASWELRAFIPDGQDPGGVANWERLTNPDVSIDLTPVLNGGFVSSGPMYYGKTVQSRVLTEQDVGSLMGPPGPTGAEGPRGADGAAAFTEIAAENTQNRHNTARAPSFHQQFLPSGDTSGLHPEGFLPGPNGERNAIPEPGINAMTWIQTEVDLSAFGGNRFQRVYIPAYWNKPFVLP